MILLSSVDFFRNSLYLIPKKKITQERYQSVGGLSCCPFLGGGSVVVDFLFIVTPIVGVCNCSVFCCTLFYVHSSIAIILMGKRELVALLNWSSWCLLMFERLFLAVPRGCLRFMIVVFPDHTHLLFWNQIRTFCRSRIVSKLFEKATSRRLKAPLAVKI